jgi:hypothetical protein
MYAFRYQNLIEQLWEDLLQLGEDEVIER